MPISPQLTIETSQRPAMDSLNQAHGAHRAALPHSAKAHWLSFGAVPRLSTPPPAWLPADLSLEEMVDWAQAAPSGTAAQVPSPSLSPPRSPHNAAGLPTENSSGFELWSHTRMQELCSTSFEPAALRSMLRVHWSGMPDGERQPFEILARALQQSRQRKQRDQATTPGMRRRRTRRRIPPSAFSTGGGCVSNHARRPGSAEPKATRRRRRFSSFSSSEAGEDPLDATPSPQKPSLGTWRPTELPSILAANGLRPDQWFVASEASKEQDSGDGVTDNGHDNHETEQTTPPVLVQREAERAQPVWPEQHTSALTATASPLVPTPRVLLPELVNARPPLGPSATTSTADWSDWCAAGTLPPAPTALDGENKGLEAMLLSVRRASIIELDPAHWLQAYGVFTDCNSNDSNSRLSGDSAINLADDSSCDFGDNESTSTLSSSHGSSGCGMHHADLDGWTLDSDDLGIDMSELGVGDELSFDSLMELTSNPFNPMERTLLGDPIDAGLGFSQETGSKDVTGHTSPTLPV